MLLLKEFTKLQAPSARSSRNSRCMIIRFTITVEISENESNGGGRYRWKEIGIGGERKVDGR